MLNAQTIQNYNARQILVTKYTLLIRNENVH